MTTPAEPQPPKPRPNRREQPGAGSAAALLTTLAVKGRAPQTGYDRDRFGPAWADADRNGCDTRNDMLARDLRAVRTDPATRGCVVLSGVLADPYSARQVPFRRGELTSSAVQVDHVVALSDAWQKGAQRLSGRERLALANDPLNLLAVDGPLNLQKGDGDAATWLPPAKGYRCEYVARQVAVKAKYDLWVTAAEQAAMARVLRRCPQEVVPTSDAPRVAPIACPTCGGGGRGDGRGQESAPSGEGTDPRFATCGDALAAGYGEYRRGRDREYRWYVDGDSDGVACER